jgi:hypothetical protein
LQPLLQEFSPISLTDIKAVELMDRVDVKFILHTNQLSLLLQEAKGNYEILQIGDNILNSEYHTVYYDTADCCMYYLHVKERANRYKIRVREYVDSSTKFLEIKFKNNKGNTLKSRIKTENSMGCFNAEEADFISSNSPFATQELLPILSNRFKRITLANREWKERITIDTYAEFSCQQSSISLGNLVVCEIKKNPGQHMTPMEHLLRKMRIHPFRISKYILGSSLINSNVRPNLYKPKIILLNKKTLS